MNLINIALAVLSLLLTVACTRDSPSAPTPPTPTKIIRLGGSLNFGTVFLNEEPPDQVMTVTNDGNDVLNVSGMQGPCAVSGAMRVIGAASFAIAPQETLDVTFRFRPTVPINCNGTVTVNSDATSGVNTFPISALGAPPPRPVFSRTGVGDSLFSMPLDVTRVRIIGIYNGRSASFAVLIGGRLIVEERIGDDWGSRRYDRTLQIGGGGSVQVSASSGVQWSFEELR